MEVGGVCNVVQAWLPSVYCPVRMHVPWPRVGMPSTSGGLAARGRQLGLQSPDCPAQLLACGSLPGNKY